jgi:hypothetical protein
MDGFVREFQRVLSAATEWGSIAHPLQRTKDQGPFRDNARMRRFIGACHRGYQKAQDRVIGLLQELANDSSLSLEDRLYKELVLRRLIDGIAFTILEMESHVSRRLVLHDSPPSLDLATIRAAQAEANRLNNESRLTFALVADLTTFIHVADLLRIDFRHPPARLSLIELKTGRVNSMLLEQLKNYEPEPSAIDRLRHAKDIDSRYHKQAERMLAQRIRLRQIQEIISHDEGIDIHLKSPIKLVGPTTPLLSYDHDLDELCDEAMADGTAAGSIQFCLHLGIAHDEDLELARIRAQQAATLAAIHTAKEGPAELSSIRREVEQMLRPGQWLKAWTHLNANLREMSDTPFVLWHINPAHKASLVAQRLAVTTIFDLASFIFLERQLGLIAELMTRKETEEETRDLPRRSILRWGNRALCLHAPGEARVIMGAGIMTRMINDLSSPAHVLQVCTRTA